MSGIHPTAIVEDGARLGERVEIGPYCTVGNNVTLGDGVRLKSHVVLAGKTEIGAGTVIFPFAVLGEDPQDLKFAGEESHLIIGARNRIREHVTMHGGTEGGGGVTRVGDDNLFMVGCHVAHDCQIGNGAILANNVGLAGHVVIEDEVILGGLAGVHQFVRVGRGAIIGGLTRVVRDVLPYSLVQGPDGKAESLNLIGLKRRGLPREDISAMRAAFRALGAGEGSFVQRARALDESTENPHVREITQFILSATDRSFHTPGG